jgi:hypothetical protein
MQKAEVRKLRNENDLAAPMTKDCEPWTEGLRCGMLRRGVAASLTLVSEPFSVRISGSTYTICGSEAWP